MKFEFNWLRGFREKICLNTLIGLQYERPWLKGQIWPLEPIYSNSIIRFNIANENNVFGFNCFKK